jgi:four helix bundle protein
VSNQYQVTSNKKGTGVKGYRRVIAFNKADVLASQCYDLAQKIKARDRWLASQLMRASISAPLNIAEGHGRGTVKDFLRFLENARSSLNEVEYLLEFLERKQVIDTTQFEPLEQARTEAAATLNGLIKSLRLRLKTTSDWQRTISDEHVEYFPGGIFGEEE